MGKKIVLVSGKARSGKDTFCGLLKKADRTIKVVSFAQNIKDVLANTFDIPVADLEDWKNQGKVVVHGLDVDTLQGGNTQSYRAIMQNFGMAMRINFGSNVWAMRLAHQIDALFTSSDIVAVSDWRFESEMWDLKEFFGDNVEIVTVSVTRGVTLLGDEASHSSEVDLENYTDYVLEVDNSGSLEELKTVANTLALYLKVEDES